MAIIDDLNTLQSNIVTVKQVLADNINTKGVSTVTSANTLTELANAVNDITVGEGGGTLSVPSGTSFAYSTWSEMPQYMVDYVKGLTEIPDYFMFNCYNVSNIELNENIKSIGGNAFSDCHNLSGNIKLKALENIKYSAFANTSINSVEITSPIAFTFDSDRQFEHCSGLTSVTITSPITELEGRMFNNCRVLLWENMVFPNTLTTIGEYCFSDCYGLREVTLPDSVTKLLDHTFYACSGMTYCNLNNVHTLSSDTFNRCESLQTVVLGKNIKQLYNNTFSGCKALTTIEARCLEVPILSGGSMFSSVSSTGILKHIPGLDYSSWIGTSSSGGQYLPSGWATEEYPSQTQVIQDSYIYQDGMFYEKVATLCDFNGDGTYVESGIETIGNELTTSTTIVADEYICDYLNGNKCEKLQIMVNTPDGNLVGSGIYDIGNVLEENCTECTVTTISYISNASNSGENRSNGAYLEFEDVPIVQTFKYQMKFNLTNDNGTGNYMFAGNLCDDVWNTNNFYFSSYWAALYNSSRLSTNVRNRTDVDLEYEWGNFYVKNLETGSNVSTSSFKTFNSTEHLKVYDSTGGSEIFRIYYLKLYDGDTLLKDLIPVLDYNGVPCLLDKLSNELHYNRKEGTTFYYA